MEWREQSTLGCDAAFEEAQRWLEEVTKKKFGDLDFRSALENGVLLCDLINRIKPGLIKRVNRLSTPIAGLDNVNVFLKACGKLGLKEAQLFHPGDLQDLSTRVTVKQEETSRRLKNVLITIYWLGRKAQVEPFYNGPNLNLRAFEGLLGIALSKVLEESAGQKGSVRDSGFGDSWYTEREELFSLPSGHRREDSLDSLDSVDCKLLSTSSEATPKSSFEGCGSDLEPDLGFRMADSKDPLQYRRSLVIEPRTAIQFNQFLPSKDKQVAYFPAPLRKKRAERHEENRRSWASPMYTEEDGTFTSQVTSSLGPAHRNGYTLASPSDWVYESDSDADRPEPDVVLDDLASRRFRSPSPMIPPNFAIPMRPQLSRTTSLPFNAPNAPLKTLAYFSAASPSPPAGATRTPVSDIPSSELYYDSEDEEEMGYADPVQDDLYARKLGWPLQPSAKEPFNKFLPKFWTPEEEARVKKIQLGSQCRPWYRKMQGFSKMSGSSSEDSDSEVSPWRAVIPTTWPQSSTPPSHPHTLGSPAHPHLHHVTAQSSHTQSHTVEQPHASFTAPLETGSPVLDPSAGPRLVKCTRAPTCGSSYPPEPYDAMGDDLPDLENDDMFTRRTHNFHRGVGLASLKSSSKMSVGALSWTEAAIVTQPRRGEPVTPDIERDDLVFRKLSHQKAECPLSGTPDIYHAVPMPEPYTLPSKLQARLLCMPCPPESEDELQHGQEQQVPTKADDMLLRRLAAGNLAGAGRPSSANQTPVMPSSCSDKDLNKWQALREASRLRYKKKLLVERLLQKRSGSIGSKSVSDIPEEPMVQRQVRYEDLQKIRAQVKECEDKWQEDLTKWKNRRRSINSDIVKKKEEREQMEQFAGGRGARALGGFGQVQEERESKEQFASSTDVCALSSDLEIKPSARNLPDQSCPNIPPETLSQRVYSSLPHGPPNLPVSTRDSRSQGSPSGIDPTQPALADQTGTSKEASQGSSVRASQEQRCYSTRVDERHSGPLYPSLSMDAKPGTARVSVSLPRSYQRSDSSRLTSVVTPRPFGSQSTKISSLPRTFVVDDSHKRFNGEMETHRSSVPNRYSQFVTSEDEDRSQTSSMQSSNEDEDEEEDQRASSFVPQTSRDVIQPKSVSKMNSNGDTEQEHYSDMRVSLSQKANGSQDFGFQTSWDSTGAHVKYIQRGSPAELCQLQVGDEILAVGGKLVSKMSYEEWKGSLDDALQQGSLVLDVRRHGKNNWAQDQPSLPYKSHKTINLTSMDPTLVGAPGNCINSSVELTSIAPTETAVKTVANCEVSSQAVSDLASKGINGGFHEEPVTMRNKGSSESAFSSLVYLCGGSESAISDMPVPSLNAASSRWSWDPEEERRRQEKWQKEQERLLQEKYKRDQERLEEAWRCAQLEAMKIDTKHNQEQGGFEKVGSRSTVGLSSPPGPPSLHAAPLLEEEQQQEVARRERQEEDEHEAVRLQEEERHEQQRGQNDDGWRKMQDADEEKHKENEMLLEQQWSGASYGFTKALPEISMSDRAKSKSTSELDVDKPGAKVTSGSLIETPWSRDSQRKKSQHLSQAELERQQILQEMKKKTQLLTDSSWIRQRSTSVHKEPVNLVGPIRRGESLDNLDSARPWRPLSWISGPANYNRPQSAFSASSLGYTCSGASTLPTSLSTGSLRQSPWFQSSASSSSPPGGTSEESVSKNHPPSQRSRSVSGRKMCTLCDLPLGKGAAMIIESLGLCYHLSCFKCVICQSDLGGSESGAEVRIRNGQLYCNDCYVKFKAGQPTTM